MNKSSLRKMLNALGEIGAAPRSRKDYLRAKRWWNDRTQKEKGNVRELLSQMPLR